MAITTIYTGNPDPRILKWINANVSPGWNFVLTNIQHIQSASLQDTASVYCANQKLNIFQFQVLDNMTLQFGTQAQGHSYIWKFEDGHSFDVSHFKTTYESRSPVISSYKSSWLKPDGMVLFHSDESRQQSYMKCRNLSQAFQLDTAGAQQTLASCTTTPIRMQWSNDGRHLIIKYRFANTVYHYELKTPWKFESETDYTRQQFDLNTIESLTWQGMYFKDDGLQAMFTTGNGYVHHFTMSSAWDLTTMTRKSTAKLFDESVELDSIALNTLGTKMLVFENKTRLIHEYSL